MTTNNHEDIKARLEETRKRFIDERMIDSRDLPVLKAALQTLLSLIEDEQDEDMPDELFVVNTWVFDEVEPPTAKARRYPFIKGSNKYHRADKPLKLLKERFENE